MKKKILVSPHNDDETLFAAFTVMWHLPQVVIVYDSYVQPSRGHNFADAVTRRNETRRAMKVLGAPEPVFLGLDDRKVDEAEILTALDCVLKNKPIVWGPGPERELGNRHHDLVGRCLQKLAPEDTIFYATYSGHGKTSTGKQVPHTPEMVQKKLLALTEYRSQVLVPDCCPHFLRSQEEYYF